MNPAVPRIMAAPIATTFGSVCAPAADFISEKPDSQRNVTTTAMGTGPAKVMLLRAMRTCQ